MSNEQVVWCVGQVRQWHVEPTDHCQWEMVGVFASEADARAACRNETYFIGPWLIGVPAPDDATEWPGAYYPLLQERSRPMEELIAELMAR